MLFVVKKSTKRILALNGKLINDKRCSLLWNHVRIHVDGNVLPCCLWNSTDTLSGRYKNIPKLEDGIEAAFNSELFNNIRQDMENGIEPEPCRVCYESENHGSIESMRTMFNKLYGFSSKKIKYIETALSTHCNLACRMCNETFSSKWFQYKNPKAKVDTSINSSILDYYDSDLSELDYIKLVGGEPMIDKNHVPFLEKLFNKSDSSISLMYHTNGTVKPSERVLHFWKKAERVKIDFSIDGVGHVNEILRPPHKWETILETIDYFKSIEGANIEFGIHSVISSGNIKHMLPLIQFSMELIGKIPDVELLEFPRHLDIRNQTKEYTEQTIKFMQENYMGFGVDDDIQYIISTMNNSNTERFSKEDIIKIENKHHYFDNNISDLL